jgi:hypothetical protein
MTEQQILELDAIARKNALILAYRIELEGMLAENEHRKMQGFSQAYGEEAFQNLRARVENSCL